MNKQIEHFARARLKADIATLPEKSHRIFKLMYGRDNGRRSVAEAEAMDIDVVIDEMPADKLDWAMTQVSNSIAKAAISKDNP